MRVVLLGTGSPILEAARRGPATLIQLGNTNLLFDAGRGVSTQLLHAGLSPRDLSAIFITHHHSDHISGLGDVMITAWHEGREKLLPIFGPRGTQAIVSALLDVVFARDIAFNIAMDRIDGRESPNIKDVFQVREVEPGLIHANDGWLVFAEYVEHGHSLGLTRNEWPCLGYRIEGNGRVVAISGDAIPCDGLDRLAQEADALVQCCYLSEQEITTPALARLAREVIASSGEVGKIAARARVRKLILTHFRRKSPEMMQSLADGVRRDYDGELYLGDDLMTIDI
jgi:ribonuclease BN (tRNA processing enzyme)